MLKVIIDTNVFLSGTFYGGNPERILQEIKQKTFIFCISPMLKAEILNKLQNKFSASEQEIIAATNLINRFGEKYIPRTKITLCKDPKDNFLLELAEEAHADYLVSGSKGIFESFDNTYLL